MLKHKEQNNLGVVDNCTIDNFPVIHINRYIYLREPQLTEQDIENFYQCYNEPEISRFLPNSVIPKSHYDAKYAIERYRDGFIDKNSCFWFIVDKRKEKMIGTVGLQSYDRHNSKTELCYEVSKKYARLGIATSATLCAINYGFQKLEMNRIEAMTTTNNKPSVSLLLNAGFKYEGTLKQYRLFKGKYVDVNMFSYIKDKYEDSEHSQIANEKLKYYSKKCSTLYQTRIDLL